MGAGLAAAAGTMAAGMATSMGASLAVSGMVSTAAGAAFTSLVSQATVSLVNNQGDLGETFRDMGESQVWQNVAFAAVTAGAMDYAGGATTSFSNNAFGTMPLTPAEFTAASRAVNVVANSTISAAAQSAIYGDNFSETFTDRLITNSVYAVGAGVAGEIGETYVNANRGAGSGELVLNYALHKVAHAGLGCAMGAATSDNCAAGAAGAVAGEIAAETYIKLKLNGGAISLNEIRQIKETGGHLATLAGAGTAFVLGADAEGVYTGANTGANAAENNALDTITDALTVLYDMGKIGYGLYVDDDGVVKEGFVDLAADGVALLIPMVPAGSTKIARLAGKADNVADGVKGGDKFVDLTSKEAREHILNGDPIKKSGGHKPGTGIPGKTEFPAGWSDDKIMHEISDIATDPKSIRTPSFDGRTMVEGTRDGVNIRVILDKNSDIIT